LCAVIESGCPDVHTALFNIVPQDASTGVMEVELQAKSPEGWMDYLMMTREYQLVQGNFGSKTLLERV
jgi:hypothetical protein